MSELFDQDQDQTCSTGHQFRVVLDFPVEAFLRCDLCGQRRGIEDLSAALVETQMPFAIEGLKQMNRDLSNDVE